MPEESQLKINSVCQTILPHATTVTTVTRLPSDMSIFISQCVANALIVTQTFSASRYEFDSLQNAFIPRNVLQLWHRQDFGNTTVVCVPSCNVWGAFGIWNVSNSMCASPYMKKHSNNTYHGREINVYSMQTLLIFGRPSKATGGEKRQEESLKASVSRTLWWRAYTQLPT